MSQSPQGHPREQRPSAQFDSFPAPPTSAVVQQRRFVPSDSVEARLVTLALGLGAAPNVEAATGEVLATLSDLLPDCPIHLNVLGTATDLPSLRSQCHPSTSTGCDAIETTATLVWPLDDNTPPSTLTVVLKDQSNEIAACALDVGKRVASLFAAFLRQDEQRRLLAKYRDRSDEFLRRAVQAEKLASFGRAVASVLHDLNNPLTAIVAYASYLERTLAEQQISPADLQRLSRIREAAERAQSHTHSLVEYARPSKSQPAEVDLAKIIQNALVFCEHDFAAAGMQTESNFARLRRPILGVAGQLTQLFVNLFTNAAHAARESGAKLEVECELDPATGCAHVCVTDHGIGIPEDHLDRIFDPFFTTKCDGRGLGLAIVRDIMESHGGQIEVQSQVGQGTTFRLWLPVATEHADRAAIGLAD